MLLKRNGIWSFLRYFNHTPNKSFYEILGVSEKATKKEIKDKFYELSKKYHPDVSNGKEENSKMFRDISEAYETLKNDDKRAQYDMSRGFGGPSSGGIHNGFWQQHDFSNYQNPNGGYYYKSQTFYYGPDGKKFKQRSNRFSQADFEDIWRRFHKQVNSEEHKEYERYQQYMRENLWKEYEKRRKESWEKRNEEFRKRHDPFYFYTNRDGKKSGASWKVNVDEHLLAKIAGVYVVIFAGMTLFQIMTEKGISTFSNKTKNTNIPNQPTINGENIYTPIDAKTVPENVGAPPNIPPNIDPNTLPYGMPR